MQTTQKFFRYGVDQKRSDFTIDLRRPDFKKAKDWTPEQRQKALEWLKRTREITEAFYEEAKNSLKVGE